MHCNYWLELLPTKALCIFPWYGCWRSRRGKLGITISSSKFFHISLKTVNVFTVPRDRGWIWGGDSSWVCSAFSEWVEWSGCSRRSPLSHFVVWTYFERTKGSLTVPCDGVNEYSKQTVFQGLVQAWFLIFYCLKSCHDMSWRNLQKKCWPGSHLARLPSVTLKVSGFTPVESQSSSVFVFLLFLVP